MKTLAFLIVVGFLLSGCMNEFRFKSQGLGESSEPGAPGNGSSGDTAQPPPTGSSPSPKPDPVVDPDSPVNTSPVVYKRGDCTKYPTAVLSCLNCQITMVPVEIPLSVKAQQLVSILQRGCQVSNKSDPVGYEPPSRSEILVRLNRANAANYPASEASKTEELSLNAWLGSDLKPLEKLFGGLWYRPSASDDFETYFGLEVKEARYMFCYDQPAGSFSDVHWSQLFSKAYADCMFEGKAKSCREKKEYLQANVFRGQLHNSIQESLNNPFNDQELVPKNKCFWETMSGVYNLEMEVKLLEWKNKGYEISVKYNIDQPLCESADARPLNYGTKVTIGGKKCTDL